MDLDIQLDIQSEDLKLIKSILKQNLPQGAKVWVFGSRSKAKGKAKPFSDLDLALDYQRKMTLEEFAFLSKAFEDSLLPYKVDLVDIWSIDPSFEEIINLEKKLLNY